MWGTVGDDILIALVLVGAVPLVVNAYQYLLIGAVRWRNHYGRVGPYVPRVAILVPAWNEARVLTGTVDRLMTLDYPPDRLRVYVVDDASTDDTASIMAIKQTQYPGSVFHLRREKGGEGKSHTLNYGLSVVLGEGWMEALLIMDADVVFLPDTLRKMTRHLADDKVGAVTCYIKEGSVPSRTLTRFIEYEYITAQAAGRRAQNVLGAVACLAGGAQLHSRANLEALGGRIDTSTLAEDTFTTLMTQLGGRRVVFEPNAVTFAEEPERINGLWKQRVRWARGNAHVTWAFRRIWFRRNPTHRLGGVSFGLIWFSIFLLPLTMIVSSASLVVLYFTDLATAQHVFRALWIVNALCFVFTTVFTLLIDRAAGRRTWVQGFFFPGSISLLIILYACLPTAFHWLVDRFEDVTHWDLTVGQRHGIMLFAYVWVAGCMLAAYLVKKIDDAGAHRTASGLLYLVGYGPVLCVVTLAAYVKQLRHAEMRWEKTEKSGRVAVSE